jgi:Protein of unknown function (DUF3617)
MTMTACARKLPGRGLRSLIVWVSTVAAVTPAALAADALHLSPGLYRVEVRIALPNVQDVAAPAVLERCVTRDDLESGRAFSVLSDNPLKACELLDYRVSGDTAAFRIACPGPNRGFAAGVFRTTATAYRGTIQMNMGAKNMTMSETQIGTRIGDCR